MAFEEHVTGPSTALCFAQDGEAAGASQKGKGMRLPRRPNGLLAMTEKWLRCPASPFYFVPEGLRRIQAWPRQAGSFTSTTLRINSTFLRKLT